ncbi:MAG: sulfurtransferase TusA family protein [Archaeoglobus sp.]|nr:sulfurtransferase TusA family protein [Archaeoglobus sp.]
MKKKGDRYVLDCKNLSCPFPLTMSKLALKKVDELEVITNNPPSAKDIPELLSKQGYQVEVNRKNGLWRIYIRKNR